VAIHVHSWVLRNKLDCISSHLLPYFLVSSKGYQGTGHISDTFIESCNSSSMYSNT
jgi:hypothetical protein